MDKVIKVIDYIVDDDNYLSGHAEVVISVPVEIWELIEEIHEDYRLCPTCGYLKVRSYSPDQYPDGEYTYICDNPQCPEQ